jgi:hypothetical protein
MDALPFLAGVLVGIGLCVLTHLVRRRPEPPMPPDPDDGIVLEFVIGDVREQPTTPNKEPGR